MKKAIKYITICLLLIILIGCSSDGLKNYHSSGLNIRMIRGLYKRENNNATIYYENEDLYFLALKETFEDLKKLDINKDTTIEDYAKEVFYNYQESYELMKEDNLNYFTYEYEGEDTTYYYFNSIHKSDDAFWICSFCCKEENKDKYYSQFINWSKSIHFD